MDANHCPGAVQLLFALPDGSRYVHCGDMRYAPHLLASPTLQHFRGPSALYLDTTYCNPRYTFPPQEQSVQYVADTIAQLMEQQPEEGQGQQGQQEQKEQKEQGQEQQGQEEQGQGPEQQGQKQRQQEEGQQQEQCAEPGVEGAGPAGCQAGSAAAECDVPAAGGARHAQLFLISTYVIGKERILLAVAQRCGCKVGHAPAAVGLALMHRASGRGTMQWLCLPIK